MINISNGFINGNMEQLKEDAWQYIYTYEPEKVAIDQVKPLEQYKRKQAPYFLTGNLQGKRNDKNLTDKELFAIDYDNLNMGNIMFSSLINDKLKDYAYIIYPTIKCKIGDNGFRFRLVINTDRPYSKKEFNILKNTIPAFIGLDCDTNAMKYSQPMGLPILNPNTDESMVFRNEGKPLKVDDFLKGASNTFNVSNTPQSDEGITHDEVIALLNAYVSNSKVSGGLIDYDYYQSPYHVIRGAFQNGSIDIDTAEQCLKILAMGNVDWEQQNVEHFKRDQSEVRNKKSIRDFFGWTVRMNRSTNKTNSIKDRLTELRFKEYEAMELAWEENGSKGKKPTTISPYRCAYILKDELEFCIFDETENTKLAIYQEDRGLWTRNETIIRRYISWLEPKLDYNNASKVIYFLTNQSKIKAKTNLRYLIPVNNGIYNLETNTLEPFSSKYIFTSKIATDYIENPEKPIIDGWDVESWIKEIANNDDEIEYLLWQVISASLNGNFSRRKSIWLVGDGNNGKGTYQQLIDNLVGKDNVAYLKLDQFSEKFKLMLLEEKVVCIGDDVPAGVYIDNSSDFNSVVTGDPVLVERKRKDVYSTTFNMTIIQSTNGMPKIHNKSNGTYRRLIIVPFKAKFTVDNDNWKIKQEYIKDEKVLQYVLHKAINMDFEQFDVPSASSELLEEYKQENDPLVDFKKTVFDELDRHVRKIPVSLIYEAYKEFCQENNYNAYSQRKFATNFMKILSDDWENGTNRLTDGELIILKDRFSSLPTYQYVANKPCRCLSNERLKAVN